MGVVSFEIFLGIIIFMPYGYSMCGFEDRFSSGAVWSIHI